jgi:hypothetical protein
VKKCELMGSISPKTTIPTTLAISGTYRICASPMSAGQHPRF